MQILANGAVPAFLALTYFFFSYELALFAYFGALAAATADTWATEIGYFSKKDPMLLIGFKRVKKANIIDNPSNKITLLNEHTDDDTGTSPWTKKTFNINQEGTYQFVFVGGSFDATGGRALCARLFIDALIYIYIYIYII